MPPKKTVAMKMSELEEKQAKEIRELKELTESLQARLATIEISQKRGADTRDVSDQEKEEKDREGEESSEQVDLEEERMVRMLKAVKGDGSKIKLDLPMYGGSLDGEELLDWIGAMDSYFEYEEISEEQKVKLAKTKLNGHASLWWDYIQSERRKNGKPIITSWDRMVAKLKGKFLPSDYSIQLYTRLQNLSQKDMDVIAYIEEFYKLSIRANHEEDEVEKMARYINGLRFNIQDELSLTNPKTVEECFQLALKAEDKLKKTRKTR